MELPKGTYRGLAKLLGPLLLWMTAGWAMYPYLIEKISSSMGEAIDTGEVQLFSYFMIAACAISGIAFLVYGHSGKEVPDSRINALNTEKWPCPRCLEPQPVEAKVCENCKARIDR